MVKENVPATGSRIDVRQEDLELQDFNNLDKDVAVYGELMDADILVDVRKEMEIRSSYEEEKQTKTSTSSELLL